MDLNIGDSVFYTRSTGLRVPAKVVGHSDEGYVELEYHQDGVRVINHHCPMDAISFGIPSWDSPPPTPSSPPPPTSPVMRLVAALSVAVHPHHPPQVHRPPTSSMTQMVAPLSVAAPRYEHHHGPHHAAVPHRAPPLWRPLGHFRMMKSKKYGRQSVNRKRRDGAYKGRIHVIVPFIGRKNGTLTARQQCYNDVHGWYRARIEQLFARLWHWGLVRNIWRGRPNELHQSVRILLHFTQFCIRRQVRHPPYGPWEHVPPQVWTDQSNSAATQDEAKDEAEVCVLCCQRRSTVAVCDECKEHYCNECIDTHTCGTNVVC